MHVNDGTSVQSSNAARIADSEAPRSTLIAVIIRSRINTTRRARRWENTQDVFAAFARAAHHAVAGSVDHPSPLEHRPAGGDGAGVGEFAGAEAIDVGRPGALLLGSREFG